MHFIGTGKEGTMCTAFSYCRFQKQRLRVLGGYAPTILGSFGSGPWAIRPKRLQWLTNIRAGFKIAAFPVFGCRPRILRLISHGRHPGESRGPFRTLKWIPAFAGMTALGEWTATLGTILASRALPHFSQPLRILIGRKARTETSPPFYFDG